LAIEIQAKNPTIQMGTQGPRGEQGPKGDPGPQGPIGPIGPRGPQGEPGVNGEKGDTGKAFTYDMFTPEQLASLTGPQGPVGPKGEPGPIGPKGEPGPKGDIGETGPMGPRGNIGDKGEKGDKGDTGDVGPRGPAGPKGDKGDAFTYADFTEAQLELLKGPKGDTGPKGEKGDKGDTGEKGDKGDKGDTGPAGAPGPTYTAGENITISADNVISATGGGGSYTLPVATDYRLGGVKAMPTAVGNGGDDVLVDEDGRLHIPKATTLYLGGVKPDGTTIKIDTNGVISVKGGSGGGSYTLPTASTTTLGGVKIDGTSITIDSNGVISSSGGSYTLPVASNDTLGGIKAPSENITTEGKGYCYIDEHSRLYVPVARGLSGGANSGVVLPNATQFEMDGSVLSLLPSTTTTLGGVKVDGTTTTTDEDGTIHAVMPEPYTLPTASTTTLGGVKVDNDVIKINENGTLYVDKTKISASNGLPSGGSYPQILMKNTNNNYDSTWSNISDVLAMAGISASGSWSATTDNSYSDLYNAKELIIFMYSSERGAIQQYYNFNYDTGGNGGCSLGANFTNYHFYLGRFGDRFNYFITWYYDGSYIQFQNSFDATCQYVLLYKT
jgi:hypothetical protein